MQIQNIGFVTKLNTVVSLLPVWILHTTYKIMNKRLCYFCVKDTLIEASVTIYLYYAVHMHHANSCVFVSALWTGTSWRYHCKMSEQVRIAVTWVEHWLRSKHSINWHLLTNCDAAFCSYQNKLFFLCVLGIEVGISQLAHHWKCDTW